MDVLRVLNTLHVATSTDRFGHRLRFLSQMSLDGIGSFYLDLDGIGSFYSVFNHIMDGSHGYRNAVYEYSWSSDWAVMASEFGAFYSV